MYRTDTDAVLYCATRSARTPLALRSLRAGIAEEASYILYSVGVMMPMNLLPAFQY